MPSSKTPPQGAPGHAPAEKRVYRFGEYELSDPPSRLTRNGEEVHLRPQVMRVLLVLVENAGEVVTREYLRQTIWRDVQHVEVERGIKTVIRELRRALDDDPQNPRYVETLRGVGYRFVASQRLQSEPLIQTKRLKQRWTRVWIAAAALVGALGLIALGASLLSPASPTMLLPRVRVAAGAEDLAPRCDKLNDALAKELVARGSERVDLIHIFGDPEELSMSPRVARYAVDGHMSRSQVADTLYISMELIDRRDGTIVWIGTYDVPETELELWPQQVARELITAVSKAGA